MAETDLVKEGSSFLLDLGKRALIGLAVIIAIIVGLFVLQTVVGVGIDIVKSGVDLLQYVVNALL